jgi:hypothetical protein
MLVLHAEGIKKTNKQTKNIRFKETKIKMNAGQKTTEQYL